MATLEISTLSEEAKNDLNSYADRTVEVFEKIGQLLETVYDDSNEAKQFTKQIINKSNWNLKAIGSNRLRLDSANIAIKKINKPSESAELGESVYSAIYKNLASAINVCKDHIKESSDKNISIWGEQLEQLQADQALIDLMKIQAQSTLAEILFNNAINNANNLLDNIPNKNDQIYQEIKDNINKLKAQVSKYSLNTFTTNDNKITEYTSSDALKVRKEIQLLCTKIKAGLASLSLNKQGLSKSTHDEIVQVLNQAAGFAKTKNDINYSNPSITHKSTAIRHRVTSTLERVSLTLGIIAIGSSALAIAAPFAMPIVGLTLLLSACIGAITGLSAALIKSSNAVANYVLYGAKPTKEEVATAAIGTASIGVAGINQLGTLVTKTLSAGTNVTKTSFAAVSQAGKMSQKDIKAQLNAMKNTPTFFVPDNNQDNIIREDTGAKLK